MKKKGLLAGLLLLCMLVLGGCQENKAPGGTGEGAQEAVQSAHLAVQKAEPETRGVEDDSSLYEYDPTQIVCFYVTVRGGNAADGTDHTLEEVNRYLNLQGMENVEKIYTEVLLQVGDEEGPRQGEFGYDGIASNATMNVRGRTSTGYPQKSYRFTLFKNAGLWRGQRAIALNKHPADLTRIRNMLYYELLRDVPGIPSLRTQFVHLYVKDLTAEEPSGLFEDYGLYTQVELPNNRYLRNHGLSIDGNLYKAQMCEMYRYPEKLKLASDPEYDASAFATVLEPKTTEDHTKLLEMLDAVNNYDLPIEEVVERYFDLDNLTSYLAFNLLMGNEDSNAQNYLLYSPVNAQKWYYLCWDGDGCLHYTEDELLQNAFQVSPWTYGISDYWGVVLFNRLLRTQSFREALHEKVEQLHSVITKERVNALVEKYRNAADPIVLSLPDRENLRVTQEVRDQVCRSLGEDMEKSYQYFLESIEAPMPFFMGDVEKDAEKMRLSWDSAYDFDGEFVRYSVQVSKDWSFSEVLWETKDVLDTQAVMPALEPGEYFWRVVAVNESGHSQVAFDSVLTATGAHNGMRRFMVEEDGTVVNPE